MRRAENDEQRKCRPGPELEDTRTPGPCFAFGEAIECCLAREFIGAEGHKVELVAQPLPRSRPRLDELTVRSKYRGGCIAVFEQTVRPLGQGKLFAGAFGRHHQHRRLIVTEPDT